VTTTTYENDNDDDDNQSNDDWYDDSNYDSYDNKCRFTYKRHFVQSNPWKNNGVNYGSQSLDWSHRSWDQENVNYLIEHYHSK